MSGWPGHHERSIDDEDYQIKHGINILRGYIIPIALDEDEPIPRGCIKEVSGSLSTCRRDIDDWEVERFLIVVQRHPSVTIEIARCE